jgi:hypothetical protein
MVRIEDRFVSESQSLVRDGKTNIIDAICHWAGRSGIEVEGVAGFIKRNLPLKAKIQKDAIDLRFLKNPICLAI